MKESSMASRLDSTVNIATLIVLILIGVSLYKTPPPPEIPKPYRVADTITALDRTIFSTADKTVLIVLRDGCTFCAESMTFYRRLLDQHATQGSSKTKFVAVVLAESDPLRAQKYVALNELPVDQVVLPMPGDPFRVPGTPAIIIADRRARISDQWLGKLDPMAENQVLEKMR